MNWLNSIDSILERGFVPRGDDDDDDENHTRSTGTEDFNESGTWSDDDDEDDESAHHVPLALMADNRNVKEDNHNIKESKVTRGDNIQKDDRDGQANRDIISSRESSSLKHPPQLTSANSLPVRPGNIRRQWKRQKSSSSSSSDEEASEKQSGDSDSDTDTGVVALHSNASEQSKPSLVEIQQPKVQAPIPILEEDFLLHNANTMSSTPTTTPTTTIDMSETDMQAKDSNSTKTASSDNTTSTPKLSDIQQINSVPPMQNSPNKIAQKISDNYDGHLDAPNDSVHPVQNSPNKIDTATKSTTSSVICGVNDQQCQEDNVESTTQQHPGTAFMQENLTPLQHNKRMVSESMIHVENVATTQPLRSSTINENGQLGTNPSVGSSGWSWSGSRSLDDDDGLSDDGMLQEGDKNTVVETTFLKEEKEASQAIQSEVNKPRSSSDDFSDEEVKTLATELEELRALVDAVSGNKVEAGNDAEYLPNNDLISPPPEAEQQSTSGSSAALPLDSDDNPNDETPIDQPIVVAKKAETETAGSDIHNESVIHNESALNSDEQHPTDQYPPTTDNLNATREALNGCHPGPMTPPLEQEEFANADTPNSHSLDGENDDSFRDTTDEIDENDQPSLPWIQQSEMTLSVTNIDNKYADGLSANKELGDYHSSDASLDLNKLNEASDKGSSKQEDKNDNHPMASTEKDGQTVFRRTTSLFEVSDVPPVPAWKEDPADRYLQPINCYGAFHIRLLRAQRLPCPVGSTVQAVASLLPWKGRCRGGRGTTFLVDNQDDLAFDHGVCAQWEDEKSDHATTMSLVHAYASEATPIPTLKIQLVMLTPMKLIEFSMCSLTIPCDALMRRPGKWFRQWFLTEMQDAKTASDSQLFGQDQTAMIEIEAVFVPDDQSFGTSFVSIGHHDQAVAENDTELVPTTSSDLSSEKVEAKAEKTVSLGALSVKDGDKEFMPSGKPHLLRVKKFWKPATCAQCSTSLLGWGKSSFRCEACGLDCCSDCRLHLDVQIPCGSNKALEIVAVAIQNKLTVSKFLEAMAPVDESYEQRKRDPTDAESSLTDTRTEAGTVSRGENGRIGVLKLGVSRACVFKDSMSPVAEPEEVLGYGGELRPGEYYVRVCRTGSEGSSRTRTIPSGGKLKFEESSEMRLDVAHYGVDFFIEVVDAVTDRPVGTTVLTTQGLLQQQRDLMLESGQVAIFKVGKSPPTFKGKQRMVLELRTGIKSGVSSDFFVSADSKTQQGEISGWVEINVGLEEDVKRLYGSTPYECPPRPPDPLNLATLQHQFSRLSDIWEDITRLCGLYLYLVSWKNPVLTGFSFLVFLTFTLRFDAEYVGCLPFLFLMLWMLSAAFARSTGNTKKRFVQEESDEWTAAEKEIGVNYSLHRPVGRINITVSKGKNIRSRDLGLSGNVGCRVLFDPLRYASDSQKVKIKALDKSAQTIHEIGTTDSKFTTSPVWKTFYESDECRRLKQVLPHNGHFFETEEEIALENGCEFPVLQPFRKVDDEDDTDNPRHINATLEPWSSSLSAIVCQVRFRDILNLLPGSDHIFGEVVVPLSALVERGTICGWYQVLDVGTNDFAEVDDMIEGAPAVGGLAGAKGSDMPQIYLELKWIPPEENLSSFEARETNREAAAVIQEELLRWAVMNRDRDKLKQLGIGALNTISGFTGILSVIQNVLAKAANTVEGLRNLLNFTDPYKSSMLLVVVTLLWLLLSLLPTRLIILVAGLAQYGLTAKARVEKWLKSDTATDEDDDVSVASDLDDGGGLLDALVVWLKNGFLSLPTDEDLRKTYFWEGRRLGAKTREVYTSGKRLARLKRLWKAHWYGTVKILVEKTASKKEDFSWGKIFAIVQGRRFLWWQRVEDFDNGSPPLGRIHLAGHAGLSSLSPLEMRRIDSKDVPFVVGIFGRGLKDQQRITLLMPSLELKESLENSVLFTEKED